MPRDDLIRPRRGTAVEWAAANPVLADGEFGWDATNRVLKVGDGTTAWNDLAGWAASAQDLADLPELRFGFTVVGGFADVEAVDVQEFTADGTWTKADGARLVMAVLIGGGGGGASGYRNAEGNLRYGGGGGAPGGRTVYWLDPDELDATEAITIGQGGAGGAAKTTNGVGVGGTSGGDTILDTIAGDVRADGGDAAIHLAGASPGFGGTGVDSARGGFARADDTMAAFFRTFQVNGQSGGGGAGASRTAANAIVTGGNGGAAENAAGGVGNTVPSAGTDGSNGNRGGGGGGGTSSSGGNGGWAGGDGGYPGGGGGGGSFGIADTPTNSGAGGAGADGYALVITFR